MPSRLGSPVAFTLFVIQVQGCPYKVADPKKGYPYTYENMATGLPRRSKKELRRQGGAPLAFDFRQAGADADDEKAVAILEGNPFASQPHGPVVVCKVFLALALCLVRTAPG